MGITPIAGLVVLFVGMFYMNKNKSLSNDGLNRLKQIEGFRSTAYRDGSGFSIGYGHFIKLGESFVSLTESEASLLLSKDVQIYENVVNNTVSVGISQNMFDALVLLTYNIGGTNFRASTLLRLLNSGDYDGAQKQFSVWNKSRESTNGLLTVNPGLVVRREIEARLFVS